METEKFDFEGLKKEAIEKIEAGQGLVEAQGAFTPLTKKLLEEAMKGELVEHLSLSSFASKRNKALVNDLRLFAVFLRILL